MGFCGSKARPETLMLAAGPAIAGDQETPPSSVRKTVGRYPHMVPVSRRFGALGAIARLMAQFRVGAAPAVCARTVQGTSAPNRPRHNRADNIP